MANTSDTPVAAAKPLGAERLYRRCDLVDLEFETTDDLAELDFVIGQDRATTALEFGIGIRREGFNVYALGPQATDKRSLVRRSLEQRAERDPVPPDICYVNNFVESHKPRVMTLPPGTGRALAEDIDQFLEELSGSLTAAFESEEYQSRRQSVQEEAGEAQQEAFDRLQAEARDRGLALLRTPAGFVFAPIKDGEVVSPRELEELSDEERQRVESEIEELQGELQKILRRVPRSQREARERIRELDRDIARQTLDDLTAPLRTRYAEHSAVLEHLDAVEQDIADNVRQLLNPEDDSQRMFAAVSPGQGGTAPHETQFRRYRVNVLVDHGESDHAPVVYEDHPTYQNLVGRVEYLPLMGALVTDFNLIKPGALHRANGGYLVLDAHRVLLQPFAWEGLKRALQSGNLRIESPREAWGLVSTVSLEPEPLAFDVKVALLGSRLLYYLLSQFDPDFPELFKVQADFDDLMDRTPENEALYARLIAQLVRREQLRPFDRDAVARVIERSARLAGDSEKLSAETRSVLDLIREADYWARRDEAERVSARHVSQAVEQWVYRSSRVRDRIREAILRDTLYIDTDGSRTGQVNGLSVIQLGEFSFGRPSRISARIRLGKGEVVDIEREVKLSGPIHAKGVLILSGFLGGRYAGERPLSLAASLVFEQSYTGVEGDSASSAELYALLSAIADVPVKQSIAVTGSVNQHGEVQPIGGVNEKIEGFFEICRARGLTGEQGVLIPVPNVKHLMLREDVVESVAEDRFWIWPIEHVDQGLEILTGLPVGARDEEGRYPEGTLNRRVEDRLAELAETRRRFSSTMEESST